MKAELVKSDFTPGIVLVVGKPHKNSFKVDSIVLHTAYCVSNRRYYIDKRNLDLSKISNNTIYICGHSNGKTIGKRTIKDIAKILVQDRNYIGGQDIYITSCKSRKLVEKLKNAILEQLKHKPNATTSFKVESKTPNGSCTIKDRNIVKQYNVKYTYIYQLKELILTICSKSKSWEYFNTSNVYLTANDFEIENKNKISLLKKSGISL